MVIARWVVNLQLQGYVLSIDQNQLLVEKPTGRGLSDTQRNFIRQHKAEIMAYLEAPEAHWESSEKLPALLSGMIYNYLHGQSAQYMFPILLRFNGTLSLECLQQALDVVSQRFDALRLSVGVAEPALQVKNNADHPIPIRKIGLQQCTLNEAIARIIEDPIELSQNPLIRVDVIEVSQGQSVIALLCSHIIMDGASIPHVLESLWQAYQGKLVEIQKKPGLPLLAIYDWLDQPKARVREFWQTKVEAYAGYTFPTLSVKSSVPVPAELATDTLAKTTCHSLTTFCANQHLSMASVVLALQAIVSSAYLETDQVCIGVVTNMRDQGQLQSVVGYLVNVLPVVITVRSDQSLLAVCQSTHRILTQALQHKQLAYTEILALARQAGVVGDMLQQVMTFQSDALPLKTVLEDAEVELMAWDKPLPKFPLALQVEPSSEAYRLKLESNSDIGFPGFVEQFLAQYSESLSCLLTDPQQSVLQYRQQAYRKYLVAPHWASFPHDTLQSLLNSLHSENLGVVFNAMHLSYQEVHQQAISLAKYLIPYARCRIGVLLQPNIEWVVAYLAIIYAGAVYVPLDDALPAQRVQFLLNDADIPVVLSTQDLVERFQSVLQSVDVIDVAGKIPTICEVDFPRVQADDIAHILYTSGSTGQPKGVAITEASITSVIQSVIQQYRIMAKDRVAHYASIGFDASSWCLLLALASGANVHLMNPVQRLDPEKLAEFLDSQEISIIFLPPAVLQQLPQKPFPHLRIIFLGGDVVDPETKAYWQSQVQLVNGYGPTETTICTHLHDYTPQDIVTELGQPISNVAAYVLDADLAPLPPGAAGELYIGGPHLASGYLNLPEQTAQAFIRNPYPQGQEERLYKTGDMVKLLPDNRTQFIGRVDSQVKIRGQRIELMEIECCLNQHASVRQAAIVAQTTETGQALVAFIVPAEPSTDGLSQRIAAACVKQLPAYMVPNHYHFLTELPLGMNGKVDRRQLSTMNVACTIQQKPRGVLATLLFDCWQQVLRQQDFGAQDDFFLVGGHSLLAVELAVAIGHALERKLSPLWVLQYRTIEAQVEALSHQQALIQTWQQVAAPTKPTLVFMHPGHLQDADVYQPWIEQLKSTAYHGNLLGIHSAFLQEREVPQDLQQVVSTYVDRLLKADAENPYILIGWSLGGVLAYEMAVQLAARGKTVQRLVLLDAMLAEPLNAQEKPIWVEAVLNASPHLPQTLYRAELSAWVGYAPTQPVSCPITYVNAAHTPEDQALPDVLLEMRHRVVEDKLVHWQAMQPNLQVIESSCSHDALLSDITILERVGLIQGN